MKIRVAISAAAKLPTKWPKMVDRTSCVPDISAIASVTAPARIWRDANVLKRGLSISGRINRCCTAVALSNTRLVTAKRNVAKKTHFSVYAMALNPGMKGTVIKNAERSCELGSKTRSSPRRSVKSPSS